MPVIKTETVYLKALGKEWRKVVNFDVRTNLFRISMPREFQDFYPDTPVAAETLDGVNKLFGKVVYDWGEASKKTRKVIIYYFAISHVAAPDEDGHRLVERNDFHASFASFPNECIGFEYEVCREITLGTEVKYFALEKHKSLSDFEYDAEPRVKIPKNYRGEGCNPRVVAWTQEREDLFRSIETSLTGMIKRVMEFDKSIEDESKLDAALRLQSSGMLRLSAPEEKVKKVKTKG